MSAGAAPAGIQAILLDIEGTTTPIAFVYDVLFPYAQAHLRRHLEQHATSPDYDRLFDRFRAEHAEESAKSPTRPTSPTRLTRPTALPPWGETSPTARLDSVVAFAEWLMERDRKSPALKDLQGRVWEEGYRSGALVGEVYADVPGAFERWQAQHLAIAIFSSGSVLAQQLLFRHSSAGDLTSFIQRYFDTAVGSKTDSESYRRVATAMAVPAGAVLFVSDITAELDAARAAGMQSRLAIRPGNKPQPDADRYTASSSFDDVVW